MDLNYLLHREQVALHRADRTASKTSRRAHLQLASDCRRMIASRNFSGSASVGAVR